MKLSFVYILKESADKAMLRDMATIMRIYNPETRRAIELLPSEVVSQFEQKHGVSFVDAWNKLRDIRYDRKNQIRGSRAAAPSEYEKNINSPGIKILTFVIGKYLYPIKLTLEVMNRIGMGLWMVDDPQVKDFMEELRKTAKEIYLNTVKEAREYIVQNENKPESRFVFEKTSLLKSGLDEILRTGHSADPFDKRWDSGKINVKKNIDNLMNIYLEKYSTLMPKKIRALRYAMKILDESGGWKPEYEKIMRALQ